MKIGMNEVLNGIERTAAEKITKGLMRDGFIVQDNFHPEQNPQLIFDLYAEKGEDKRIYELKIGKNKIQQKQYLALQREAKRLDAKLYIVYLEVPRSKKIKFDGLDKIILEDLSNKFTDEISSLSTYTTIEAIDDIELDFIHISDNVVKISGSGTLNVHLQSDLNSASKNNNSITENGAVDFFFRLDIDISKNIVIKHYYKIDIV